MSERNITNSFTKPFVTNPGSYGANSYGVPPHEMEILHHLRMLDTNVNCTQQQMREYLNITEKRIQAATRKRRKSLVNQFMAAKSDGEIMLVDVYNDGSQEARKMILNVCGEWKVYRIHFSKIEQQEEKFAIFFPSNRYWIIGNVNKSNGKYLYEYFIRAGIVFNSEIRKSQIQEALFKQFAPQIDNSCDRMEITELAGWNNNRYLFAENFIYSGRKDFPELPILYKSFRYIEKADKYFTEYFTAIQNIKRWQDRLLIMMYPVIGVLSSVLAEEGIKNMCYMNLVLLESFEKEALMQFFQIFNRGTNHAIMADLNDKNLREELQKVNDEVFIVDAAVGKDSVYRKKKGEENVKKIIEKLCKNSSSFDIQRKINAALVIFNDSVIAEKRACNIFVTKEFIKDERKMSEALRSNAMSAFLSSFISYAERHMEDIRSIMRKYKNEETDEKKRLLMVTWEIIANGFWESEGVDLAQEAKFPIQIDFDSLCENPYDSDSLLDILIQVVRKEIFHFYILEKRQGVVSRDLACYYQENNLWIPPQILDRMLSRNGMLPQKLQILSELKSENVIHTDADGLTRRIQINGKRFEAYQFRRDFFNKPGWVDIVDLGKGEILNVER